MSQTLDTPLYVGIVESDISLRRIGGPFDDIDDALDCCWDMVLGEDVPRESLFLIETGRGSPHVRALPADALPAA